MHNQTTPAIWRRRQNEHKATVAAAYDKLQRLKAEGATPEAIDEANRSWLSLYCAQA